MVRKLFIALFVFLSLSPSAHAGSWSFELPAANGSVSATESSLGCTLTGVANRFASGFVRLTFTGCSGTNCDKCLTSNPRYDAAIGRLTSNGIELPGFGFWGEPLLYFENRLIQSIATGGRCPGEHWQGNYFFLSFDPRVLPNMRNLNPLFGTFHHDGITDTSTIQSAYSVYNGGTPTYDSFPMGPGLSLTGPCNNGQMNITGSGDRGGRLLESRLGRHLCNERQ